MAEPKEGFHIVDNVIPNSNFLCQATAIISAEIASQAIMANPPYQRHIRPHIYKTPRRILSFIIRCNAGNKLKEE